MKPSSIKLFSFFAGFLAICVLIGGYLFKLQLLEHSFYSKEAARMHIFVREINGRRGAIYDRNLMPVALTLPCYRVWADPCLLDNPRDVAAKLAPLLGLRVNKVARVLADTSARYRILRQSVDPEDIGAVANLGIRGIVCQPAGKRVRPLGDFASNVIGATSPDGVALSGIELFADEVLRGKPGKEIFLRDALGQIRPCANSTVQPPSPGNSLVLTIDAELQYVAEQALEEAIRINKAKAGGVVVVDPWTGEILAMASFPRRPNFPVEVTFEPGSALKICTYSAALETNKLKLDEIFHTNNGVLKVSGGYIRDDHPKDPVTTTEAFARSSNVVAATIARRLGQQTLYRYLVAFGFGRRTGIELKGEAYGILRPPDKWSKRSLETIAFGQEVGVTAVQLAMAFATIANGGQLLRPRLVKAIIKDGWAVCLTKPQVVRRVIRKETAAKLTHLMEAVVSSGTGVPAQIDGIRVAGKTGTGQKAQGGQYLKGKCFAVFGGFVPADNPRYVCTVVIEDPSGWTSYGGPVCGPVFKKIMEYALRRARKVIPSTATELAELPLDGSYQASTEAADEFDLASTLTPGRQETYPSVLGLTLREAAKVLEHCGIKWRATGSGLVVRQDPSPGKPIDGEKVCKLVMETIQ